MKSEILKFYQEAKQNPLSAVRKTYNYLGHKKLLFIRDKFMFPNTVSGGLYNIIYRPIFNQKYGSGVCVVNQDWDNLIILDALRADYAQKHLTFDGNLSTVVSKGNWSLEFVVNNFRNKRLDDTVCVTANPYYQDYSDLDETVFYTLIDSISEQHPKEVTTRAINAYKKHPNKRLIVHYMQPHGPYLGETADQIKKEFGVDDFPGMMDLARNDIISKETLQQCYIENINIVERHVRTLVEKLNGKTVITSDHGENLGEVQHGIERFGHGYETAECRLVPWLVMEYEERKKVVEESPIGFDQTSDEEIEEQLENLGYM